MGGGSLLRIGLTHKDFLVSLTMWVWVDFIVWWSEGASREGPGGGGAMFAVCLVSSDVSRKFHCRNFPQTKISAQKFSPAKISVFFINLKKR